MKRLNRDGFSLVEVTVALGIAAFCFIAVFGLVPVGVQTSRNATSQTRATNIMAAVAADLRATPQTIPPGNASTSLLYQIPIPANPVSSAISISPLFFADTGTFATTIQADSRYRLSITFSPNAPATHAPTYVDIKVTWPAAVDPATVTPAGSAEMLAALDRN